MLFCSISYQFVAWVIVSKHTGVFIYNLPTSEFRFIYLFLFFKVYLHFIFRYRGIFVSYMCVFMLHVLQYLKRRISCSGVLMCYQRGRWKTTSERCCLRLQTVAPRTLHVEDTYETMNRFITSGCTLYLVSFVTTVLTTIANQRFQMYRLHESN